MNSQPDTGIQINWTAVRAYLRLWRHEALVLAQMEANDAGFDAGEFSARYHDQYQREVQLNTLHYVADRFNMAPAVLEEMLAEADSIASDWFYYAQRSL